MATAAGCHEPAAGSHQPVAGSHEPAAGSYEAAVRDLNRLQTNHSIIAQIKASGGRLNLHSIPEFGAFVEKLGHSVDDLDRLNVIHVAGTKGKGSTCAFVGSLLAQLRSKSGRRPLKIGLYTSPHLIEARERIQIDGAPVSHATFAKYFYETYDALRRPDPPLRRVAPESPDMPMYFRFLTLMAFHAFLRERVDVAIMEVVESYSPPRGLRHCNSLGSTLAQIAWHKAGIIKPHVPVFSVEQHPDALAVVEQRARDNDAPLHVVAPLPARLELGIPGAHQRANAALAVALCRAWIERTRIELADDACTDCTELADDAWVARGLRAARWPGRSQTFVSPRVPTLTWHVDGAHTIESMAACAQWFGGLDGDAPCVLLFNAAHDRDAGALLRTLHEHTAGKCRFIGAVFCPNINRARADSVNFTVADDAKLQAQHDAARVWAQLAQTPTAVVPSINDAVAHVEATYTQPVRVLATGSLHLVGGVLDSAKGSV
ncbi:Folylpolyglutamate synthetase [Coemansia sp. RSA 2708]|nr:Folylpolyglutamate synthetase [Coemansia sp. RSA 2708]